jgi:hypothetical protein
MSDELETIIQSAEASIRRLLIAAFEAGEKTGRETAAKELASEMAGFVANISKSLGRAPDAALASDGDRSRRQTSHPPVMADRAAPGSVKPVILKIIKHSEGTGKTLREIERETGFKYNSVRGTLWQLQQNGEIEKVGDEYRARPQKIGAADGEPRGESSTASVPIPAHGREADPGGGT